MFERIIKTALLAAFAVSIPASAHALWRTVVRLNESKVIYLSDSHSYRLKHTSNSATPSYKSGATHYYELSESQWVSRTNGTGFVSWKFNVDIQDLPSLAAEISDDAQGFVRQALRDAKNYPIKCYIEVTADSANKGRIQSRIVCQNTALPEEPYMASSSPVKGKKIELQVEY